MKHNKFETINKYKGVLDMLEEFSMEESLMKGQIHESKQFKLVIDGKQYKGALLEGKVQWYQPQPYDEIDKQQLVEIESQVDSIV